MEYVWYPTMWVITKAMEVWVHSHARILFIIRALRTPIAPSNNSPTHIHNGLIYLPYPLIPHGVPIPSLTQMHTKIRTESKLLLHKMHSHRSRLITLFTCGSMFPWYLNLFLNYSYRILKRHELRNIHQERTTSQNTAYTHHIRKRETISTRKNLEHLLDGHIFYAISTRSPFIKETLEHNPITDKNTFKLILFAYGNGISPDVFMQYLYTFVLNTPSKTKKRTTQIHWYASTQMILFWNISMIFLVF